MNAAIAGRPLIEQSAAPRNRLAQPAPPPLAVKRHWLADVKRAHSDWRIRIEEPNGQKTVLAIVHHRQFACGALAILLANAFGEEPRMPTSQGGFRRRGHAQAQGGPGC